MRTFDYASILLLKVDSSLECSIELHVDIRVRLLC
jgi:hypothetical protein